MSRIKSIFLFFLFIPFVLWADKSLYYRGVEKMVENKLEEAKFFFKEDIRVQPNFSAYYNLGVIYGDQKEWRKAKWAFESSLKYNPMNSKAQYNAEFTSRQINENHSWEHPYSWFLRFVIGVGSIIWTIFLFVSSVFLGIFAFLFLSKRKEGVIYKRTKQLSIPLLMLLSLSFISLKVIDAHFSTKQYAIAKEETTEVYLTPNGIKLDKQPNFDSNLKIKQFTKDSTWVKLSFPDEQCYWLKISDVLVY